MGITKIEWTSTIAEDGTVTPGYSFNPWVGCTKVGPPCDNCYAESWAKRSGHPELWQGERRRTTEANWRLPIKWNAKAKAEGVRPRVFCASLADVFDNQVPTRWRDDLWFLIDSTPDLDWLLLTKRPQNIVKMLPDIRTGIRPRGDGWANVWLGATMANQEEYDRDRIKLFNAGDALGAMYTFASIEPMLGPVILDCNAPDWIICGGESGGHAREMDLRWARDLRDCSARFGRKFFFKQTTGKRAIPHDLMVREFPR